MSGPVSCIHPAARAQLHTSCYGDRRKECVYVDIYGINFFFLFCVAGDAGYPLEPWLMTPLDHYEEGTQQFAYTHELCQARNVVERFFGVLKSVFRCLSYQRVLMYEPGLAGRIVNACAALHNMRIHHRLPLYHDDDDAGPREGNNPQGARGEAQNEEVRLARGAREGRFALATRIQNQILSDRFPDLRDGRPPHARQQV